MRKIYLSISSASFNTEMQEELFRCDLHSMKFILLKMVDKETKYEKRVISTVRKVDVMTFLIERHWIYRNGRPEALSADPGLCNAVIQTFLASLTYNSCTACFVLHQEWNTGNK